MQIVWDEPKRQANIVTHGLDLADAESFDWETAIVIPGHAGKGGRPRFRAIGRLGQELVTLVFSPQRMIRRSEFGSPTRSCAI
jgi:hypothetical protein